jgi:hypothetical protein
VTLTKSRLRDGLVLLAAGVIALGIAGSWGVQHVPASDVLDSVQAAVRAVLATLVVFGVAGFGVTRLLLPEGLRRYELLWVVPVGACALALTMTVLGFAFVPFHASLAITLAGGVAVGLLARRGAPRAPTGRGLFWPAAIAFLLAAVALVPYFGAGFPTVTGSGSDAFHAVGAADFLQHNHPLERHADGPLDRFPLRWGSKQPVYYALGSVASVSGLEPYETLSPVAAVMFALAAIGIFLLARELLGASLLGAGAAMAVTGLNAMVLKTALNPYFNQTWGYFTLPFTLVLAWWAIHHRSRSAAILLAPFLAVGGLAYPLMLPIPLLAIAIFLWLEPIRLPSARALYRGWRSLLWAVPLALLLAVPAAAAAEKVWDATVVLVDPGHSLEPWGGDIFSFIPAYKFFSLPEETLWWLAVAAMAALAMWLLFQLPRALGVGLGTVMVAFLAAGAWFRQRDFGQYFEFKTLAFSAPLLVTCAAVALSRFRRVGPVLLALFVVSAALAARLEVRPTGNQLSQDFVELRDWAADLPADASIRLDTTTTHQLWGSYMLSSRRLCSELPLLHTDYPHVVYSRNADFILTDRGGREFYGGHPPDSALPPLRRNSSFTLYRAKADLPGDDVCSKRLPYGREGVPGWVDP